MMPVSKEKARRIYIIAFVISFLLIVGSIYLHLRQKTHLGRMSFNLDLDRIKPTSGVETTTWMEDYDMEFVKGTTAIYEDSDEENILEESSTPAINHEYYTDDDIDDDIDDDSDDEEEEEIDWNDEDDDDDYKGFNSEPEIEPDDSYFCLKCLCMTINLCSTTYCGSENPCGLYKISKYYWIDGGKPTIVGGSVDNIDQDYLTCVNDAICSATAIHQYYNRYKIDCNKDGRINCEDLIMLHFFGPSGCLTQNLSFIHKNRMRKCFRESNINYLDSDEY